MRIIAYTPTSPEAASRIVKEAKALFNRAVHTDGHASESTHMQIMNGELPPKNAVTIIFGWANAEHRRAFWTSNEHRDWCKIILRGWKQKGSTSADPMDELLAIVRAGKELPDLERDLSVPDNEVLCIDKLISELTV